MGVFGSWDVDINWVEGGTKQFISEVGINPPPTKFFHMQRNFLGKLPKFLHVEPNTTLLLLLYFKSVHLQLYTELPKPNGRHYQYILFQNIRSIALLLNASLSNCSC